MTGNKTKKLLVLMFHTLSSRNFLTTTVAKNLSQASGLETYVLVPQDKLDFYIDTFTSLNFKFIGIDDEKLKRNIKFNTRMMWFLYHLQQTEANDNRLKYYLHKTKSFRSYIEYILHITVFKVMAAIPGIIDFFHFLDRKLVSSPEIEEFLKANNIDAIFSTDVFNDVDSLYGMAANRNNIPVIAMLRSWDNPTSKGLLRFEPKHLLVNNPWLKQRMSVLHNLSLDKITPVGSPQFDLAFHFQNSQENFRSQHNIPPNKKLVLFGCSGYLLDQLDAEICQILQEAKNKKLFHQDVLFLVRPHPSSVKYFEALNLGPDFILLRPGKFLKKNPKYAEFTETDQYNLMWTLANADLMIYSHTTLAIDALPFDLPEIVICFPGLSPKNRWSDPLIYHSEEHFNRFIETGASQKVFSAEQLIEWVNKYLENPTIHRENRLKASEQEIFSVDGKGGDNVAKAVLEFIDL